MSNAGLFIVLYGVNGTGKSTQATLLADRLAAQGDKALHWKYPAYELSPTGPMLNEYLREGNPRDLSAREFQILQATNRTHRECAPQGLRTHILNGIHVVAEDYVGTSIAWGHGAGVDKGFLMELNSHLRRPDIEILLHGEPFVGSEEQRHRHENDHDLVDLVRAVHIDLARSFGWDVVAAEQSKEEVHDHIWSIVESRLLRCE